MKGGGYHGKGDSYHRNDFYIGKGDGYNGKGESFQGKGDGYTGYNGRFGADGSRPGAWRNDRRPWTSEMQQNYNGYHEASASSVDQQINALQADIVRSLDKYTEKQTKTFDLIFEILSTLQGQHAQLEKSIQQLTSSNCNGMQMANNQQQQQWQPVADYWNGMNSMQQIQPQQGQQMQMQMYSQAMPSGGQQWQAVPASNQQWQTVPAGIPATSSYAQQCQGGHNHEGQAVGNASVSRASNEEADGDGPISSGPCNAVRNEDAHQDVPTDNGSLNELTDAVDADQNYGEEQPDLDPDTFITCAELARTAWDKTRIWKVVNLDSEDTLDLLKVTTEAMPYAPGKTIPAANILVAYLKNGDLVRQIGHSKKVRGHMVMPVLLEDRADTDASDREDRLAAATPKDTQRLGWTTRRVVNGVNWFEDVGKDEDGADER